MPAPLGMRLIVTRPAAQARPWVEALRAAGVPDDQKDQIIAETVALLAPALQAADGQWVADYVRIRFSAHLPE